MPSTRYLWASLSFGVAIEAWLFLEAGLHGAWFVILGSPSVLVCTYKLTRLQCGHEMYQHLLQHLGLERANESDTTLELKEPFMSVEDRKDQSEYEQECCHMQSATNIICSTEHEQIRLGCYEPPLGSLTNLE